MIINSQRTIYGIEAQNDMLVKGSYSPRINTTLNDKFNHLVNEAIGQDTKYKIKCFCIGVGGIPVTNNNGYSYSQHSPTDAALFSMIPFVLRLPNNDLTVVEQSKYRMRIATNIGGTDYIAYYLKNILDQDTVSDIYLVNSGATNTLSVINTDSPVYLNPTPTLGRTNISNSNYVIKSTKIRFNLTPSELTEINNVIDIMYGTNSGKHITEIGIVGGLDKIINNSLEIIKAQIYFHIGVDINTLLSYDPLLGYDRSIEIGGSEPLYV